MIDLLVISHATFRAVNRSVFQLMQDRFKLKVEIVAPKELVFVEGAKSAEPPSHDAEIMHYLELDGSNPRTYNFKGLIKLLAIRKPKVIYLENDPISKLAIQTGRWCQLNKSKLICLSCENLDFGPWASFRRTGIKGLLVGYLKLAMCFVARKRVDHVFTINNAGLALFQHYQFKSVSKTPLGFNPAIFYPDQKAREEIRQKLGVSPVFVVAYIGRMVPEKGVDLLIRALKQIEKLNWTLMLDRFSDTAGTYQAFILSLINDLQLQDRVVYFDANHQEISQYMNAADVVVMPSLSSPKWVEQYGRVAPEAMACGKLVLAANTGALPELIADAGVLFEEGNTDQLSQNIEQMILQPESFEHYPERAVNRATKELSIHSQAATIFDKMKAWI